MNVIYGTQISDTMFDPDSGVINFKKGKIKLNVAKIFLSAENKMCSCYSAKLNVSLRKSQNTHCF